MEYFFSKNTYFAKPKDDLKDRIEIEVGDSKQADFLPQLKIMRWDNEVNFSIRLKHYELAPKISKDGEKIKWQGEKVEAHFYDFNEGEGGHEFEVILKEKPKINIVEFSLNTKGVDFLYQAELTKEQKDRGMLRPENVDGSYAVYASEEKINYKDGKEYKCGKVGHIYRPKIIDSVGKEVWGKLNIDIEKSILSVEIPLDFLEKAIFPIRHAAGLTFGYTGIGATTSYYDILQAVQKFAGVAGTGVSMSAYIKAYSAGYTGNYKMGLFGISADTFTTLITNGETNTGTTSATFSWHTQNFISAPTLSAIDYGLALMTANYTYLAMDIDISGARHYHAPSTWPTWKVNQSFIWENRFSIYCTYEAGGAAGPAKLKTWNGLALAKIKTINGLDIAKVKTINGLP